MIVDIRKFLKSQQLTSCVETEVLKQPISKFSIRHVFKYPLSLSHLSSLRSTLILSPYLLLGLPKHRQRQDFTNRNLSILHFFSNMYVLDFTIVKIFNLYISQIRWTDYVRNEEVLLQVNEQMNILHAIKKRKPNWIGHILCRNYLLKHVIEGKIKGEI